MRLVWQAATAVGRCTVRDPRDTNRFWMNWTGRAVRADKTGAIEGSLPSILRRLNIDAHAWQLTMRPSGNVFGRAIGPLSHLRLHAKTLGQSWIRGLRQAERFYAH